MHNASTLRTKLPSKLKNPIWLFPLIFIVGSFLRLWHLGTWSFWVDEVLTVLDAHQLSVVRFPINPIPYLAVKFSTSLAGTNEWGARLIPCLVGIASIPLIFLMGRSLFNLQVGIFAATFLAFSSWHVFWSQNARSYVFTVFFAILAAWSFYVALERDRPLLMSGSLVATILLLLSHTLSGVIALAFAGYVIGLLRIGRPLNNSRRHLTGTRLRNLAIFFLPLALPVVLLVVPRFRSYLFSGWGLNQWGRSPLYTLFTLIHGLSVPVAVVAFFTAFHPPVDRKRRFLVCYAGIPLVLFLISSHFLNVAGYYLFFTTPAYLLLAAVGCNQIWRMAQIPLLLRSILPCVIIITMLSQDYLYFRIENGGRPKWREAFSTIRAEMRADDRVVLSIPRVGEYYLPELETISVKAVMADPEGIEQRWGSQKGRVWFVIDAGNWNVVDAGEQFRAWIRQKTRLIQRHTVFARAMDRTISVYLWESENH